MELCMSVTVLGADTDPWRWLAWRSSTGSVVAVSQRVRRKGWRDRLVVKCMTYTEDLGSIVSTHMVPDSCLTPDLGDLMPSSDFDGHWTCTCYANVCRQNTKMNRIVLASAACYLNWNNTQEISMSLVYG